MTLKDFLLVAVIIGFSGWNGVVTVALFIVAALAHVNGAIGMWAPLAVPVWPFVFTAAMALFAKHSPPGGYGK